MQSCQKAQIEKNHTLFRDIVPKGSSFDHFTQDTVNLIFSHINGVRRNIYSGKSPYEMFTFAFSEELAALLGISYVAPEDVVQSPRLLKG
jgi:ISSag9, transposase